MAKKIKPVRQLNRRHISRLEKERKQRRYATIGVIATFVLIVLLMAGGLLDNYVLKPARPVATVAGEAIRTDDYQTLLQYRRYDSQMYLQTLNQQRSLYSGAEGQEWLVQYIDSQIEQIQQSYSLLPTTVLDQMIEDLVIRQEAARRGITASADEVQALLEQQFGYDPEAAAAADVTSEDAASQEDASGETPAATEAATATATAEPTATTEPTATIEPTAAITVTEVASTEAITSTDTITSTEVITPTEELPTPTPYPTEVPMTADEFASQTEQFFSTIEAQTGLTEDGFRHLLESSLLQDKVEEALKAEMPTTAEQVHARHILVATEEEAQDVLDRLAAGESFESLASELSLDTASAADGGDLGWFTRGTMVDAFEGAAFSLEPGEISEPIATEYGYHIIQVLEHETDRALDADALATYQDQLLSEWYTEKTTASDVVRHWSLDLVPDDPFASG